MTDSRPILDTTEPAVETGLQLTFPSTDASVAVFARVFTGALVLFTIYQAYFRLELGLLSVPTGFLFLLLALHLWLEWFGRRTVSAIEIASEHLALDWGDKQLTMQWEEIDRVGYVPMPRGNLLIVLRMADPGAPGRLKFILPRLALYGEPARKPVLAELARYIPVCHRFR
jgi:hypothetical protein